MSQPQPCDSDPDTLVRLVDNSVPEPQTRPAEGGHGRPPQLGGAGGRPGAGAIPPAAQAAGPTDSRQQQRPTAADFTAQGMLRPGATPPQHGWRRVVYRATFGAVNVGPGPAELAQRALIARVTASVAGSRRIVVLSRKGGVGKTTTTAMLGATFASWRGDRVVALDANPDAGCLAYRVRRETAHTVTGLLEPAARLERYADIRAYTSQTPSRLEVVAADDDPAITRALGEADYQRVIGLLDRHYNVILVDTGTGILDSGIQGILKQADQLVVVLPPALDGARVAASTLDWLDRHGYAPLVTGAVAVINGVRRRGLVDLDRVEQHFAARCAACLRVPFDPHLEAGSHSSLGDLHAATRDAYLRLAAAVADGFAQPPARASKQNQP